jgi:hypothetical protein
MKSVHVYRGPMADQVLTLSDTEAGWATSDDWGQDVTAYGPNTVWKTSIYHGDVPASCKTWYSTATGMTAKNSPPGTFPMFPASGFYWVISAAKSATAILNMSAADAAHFVVGTGKIAIQGAVAPITALNGTHDVIAVSGSQVTVGVDLSGVSGFGPWSPPELCAKPL